MENYTLRIVVKFIDDLDLPYVDGVEEYIQENEIGPWDDLIKSFPGITLKRLYVSVTPTDIRKLMERAVRNDPDYNRNLLTYFVIYVPPDVDPEALVETLLTWETIETAYIESPPQPPPAEVNAGNNPLAATQGHTFAAPDGIGANITWARPDGDGSGVRLVDLERGWILDHDDLIGATGILPGGPGISLIPNSFNLDEQEHGTAVLGVIAAQDNNIGVVGIAPNTAFGVVSGWRNPLPTNPPTTPSPQWNIPDAILNVVNLLNTPFLSEGDVLLLEVQVKINNVLLPAEAELAIFDAIDNATTNGIVVVEAAGNGDQNLDIYPDNNGDLIFNTGFRDSRAIMVSASSAADPHGRKAPANYGSRIDCYAWGENIVTTGISPGGTFNYAGQVHLTSGAAAIIAGVALVVQSMARNRLGSSFVPTDLRGILSNNGTPSADPIGQMPDLAMIDNVIP